MVRVDGGSAMEGGIIGALVAFGEPAGLALAGVLTYRALAFWLPTVPGIVANIRLVPRSRRNHR